MRYEIINPSDKCFIHADDEQLAKVVGIYLGNGMYGLQDEDGNTVLHIFESLEEAFDMEPDGVKDYIERNLIELAEVFESFEYASERTSLNNIEKKAKRLAAALRAKK